MNCEIRPDIDRIDNLIITEMLMSRVTKSIKLAATATLDILVAWTYNLDEERYAIRPEAILWLADIAMDGGLDDLMNETIEALERMTENAN